MESKSKKAVSKLNEEIGYMAKNNKQKNEHAFCKRTTRRNSQHEQHH